MNSTPTIQLAPTELPSVTPIGNLLSSLDEATQARVLELRYMKSPLVEAKTPFVKMIQEKLMSCSYLDIEQGRFIRTKITQGRTKFGPMGTIRPDGYIIIMVMRSAFLQSHLVNLWFTGELPKTKEEMDHIDGNPANDYPGNLRLVNRVTNMCNRSMQSNNSSGYTGVFLDKGKYYISYVKKIYIGSFTTAYEAHLAREAYITTHPELGFTFRHGA